MLIFTDILPGWEGYRNVVITDIDIIYSITGEPVEGLVGYTAPLVKEAELEQDKAQFC